MIGFRAKYLRGTIEIDHDELDDARWFDANELPALPGALSLSRQMIDAWMGERKPIPRL
jgi:NAD+ diphosphatase